jgi:hypothetical protein
MPHARWSRTCLLRTGTINGPSSIPRSQGFRPKTGTTLKVLQRHASEQGQGSPLFEILFTTFRQAKPLTCFASARHHGGPLVTNRVEVEFTAKEFIATCIILDIECQVTGHIGANPITMKFRNMVDHLCKNQVNILEFLSTEMTDDLFERCRFVKRTVHYLCSVRNHVVFDLGLVDFHFKTLNRRQGFPHVGSQMVVPPYLPNKWGLGFDYAVFLEGLQAVEVDMDGLKWPNFEDFESFDILHKRMHQLESHQVDCAEFMDGREPAEGTLGAFICKYLLDSLLRGIPHPIYCQPLSAHVVSNGVGFAFLQSLPGHGPPP